MPQSTKLSILIIDDEPDSQMPFASELRKHSARQYKQYVKVCHPADIEPDDLNRANLVLVDYKLEDWNDVGQVPISMRPRDGIGVIGVLRSHVRQRSASPTAFALHTGHPQDLSNPFPRDVPPSTIARAYGLEWFFPKTLNGDEYVPHIERILELARAVKMVSIFGGSESARSWRPEISKLLALDGRFGWSARAWAEVQSTHPPVSELSVWSHGVSLLSWLLHRVLPYPSFLLSSYHVAARCGITERSFVDAYEKSSAFRSVLANCEYKGACCRFLGPRWWRAGVEDVLWRLMEYGKRDRSELPRLLEEKTEYSIQALKLSSPVVVVDELQREHDIVDVSSAVRVGFADWPTYAEAAWVPLEKAKEVPDLAALVIEADRALLGDKP